MPGPSPKSELQEKILERLQSSMEMDVLDAKVETLRKLNPPFLCLNDLPLSPQQKACVLEWASHILSKPGEKASPLKIQLLEKTATSEQFLNPDGSPTYFHTLQELETQLLQNYR